MRWVAVLIASVFCGAGCAQTGSNEFLQNASAAVAALQSWYVPETGLWRTTNWWNAANAITVLVNYSRMSGDETYKPAIENTFDVNLKKGFLNKFYDDEGWWALAWIDAYDWTHQKRYLDAAADIFADMTKGWDDTCGGGIWWSKARTYKNAIANELFLSVAANLATRMDTGGEYLSWARREWQWFAASGMINANHLVNDGLNASCRNNGKRVWTYNQGVILGGLAALARATKETEPLEQAQTVALAAVTALSDSSGILHEPCEPNCGNDGPQFKGIFTRNLAALEEVRPLAEYENFLTANARSIWNHDRGPSDQLGLVWSGPFAAATAATQSSAMDCLLAAAALSTPVQ